MNLTKERLVNTNVFVGVKGGDFDEVLADSYILACKSVGLEVDHAVRHHLGSQPFLCIHDFGGGCSVVGQVPEGSSTLEGKEQLHLSDLISLDNSKVYTTDPEIVRMYGGLCGKEVLYSQGNPVGFYSVVGNKTVRGFCANSTRDMQSDIHEITEAQVLALYRERFGDTQKVNPRTRTEYVKVEFDHAWEAVKAHEDGNELYADRVGAIDVKDSNVMPIKSPKDAAEWFESIYRKQEVEVDWRDELKEWANKECNLILSGYNAITDYKFADLMDRNPDEALELCRVALRSKGEIE